MLQVVTDISGYRKNWAYLDWARNLINNLTIAFATVLLCLWQLQGVSPLSLERVKCNEMFGPLMLFFVKKKALASKKLTAFKFTDKMRYATDSYIPSPKTEKSSMLRNNRMCLFSC